jgi:hypothetical protein
MASNNKNVSGWVGWVAFAGIYMVIVGIFEMITGFVSLFKNDIYLVGRTATWFFDFSTWGWIHMLLGLIVLLVGLAILAGQTWGRVVGVIMIVVSLIATFAFLPIYPLWSIIILVVDALVLYALVAHGAEMKELE